MRKGNIFLLLIGCFLIISCQKTKTGGKTNPDTLFATDTLYLKENTVLLFYPRNRTIDSLKNKHGDDFYTVADDANFYSAEIIKSLDSLKVPYRNISDSIKIIIKNPQGQKKEVKNTNKDWYWYVVTYDVKTDNYTVSSIVDEDKYKNIHLGK